VKKVTKWPKKNPDREVEDRVVTVLVVNIGRDGGGSSKNGPEMVPSTRFNL